MTLKDTSNSKSASEKTSKGLVRSLMASQKRPEVAAKMLADVCLTQLHDRAALQSLFCEVFEQLSDKTPMAQAQKLKEQYRQALKELQAGPVRPATYVGKAKGALPGPHSRVEVVTPEGHRRFPTVAEDVNAGELRSGETVYLDPEGAVVLGGSGTVPQLGQQAVFQRGVPDSDCVELKLRDERFVVQGAQSLLAAVESQQVKRRDHVLFCPRRQFAFHAVPGDKDHRHRFVDPARIPDVVVQRDIGKPHWCLAWLLRRTHILINRPDVLERFDLRPRVGLLMTGPSGTGKTIHIRAYLREFYNMLVERTGRTDIGSRVIRVKTSDLLSPWFGETDQNIDELFNNVMELGSAREKTSGGEEVQLPVVLILEECEALARRRGETDGSGVYDRVIGTLLQRLDDPTDDLAGLPLITLATSNRPDMLDVAMWRRLARMVARFERIDREGFYAILSKKVKQRYPFASHNGHSPAALRQRLIDQVVAAFFSPNLNDVQVEITLRDGTKLGKSRRHFLTGAIVEEGVSEAIDRAAFPAAESNGKQSGIGLTPGMIVEALYRQIDDLADNLTVHNVGEFLDLPENAHVADVRRLRSPKGHAAGVFLEE